MKNIKWKQPEIETHHHSSLSSLSLHSLHGDDPLDPGMPQDVPLQPNKPDHPYLVQGEGLRRRQHKLHIVQGRESDRVLVAAR
jgi:hypothetical protein